MRFKPPKITIADIIATTMPIMVASKPKAVCNDKEIVLD